MRVAVTLAPLVAGAALVSACGLLDPQPDPSRFFVLASFEDGGTAVEPCGLAPSVRVGLGPVTLPEYLEPLELLTRSSPTELTRSTTDRWAEPLETMLPRVLGDDLARALGIPRVELYPWYASDRPDWQIEVDVERFEPDQSGEALLVARWRVKEAAGQALIASGDSRLTREAAGNDAAQRSAALSAALGALAEEIARATCAAAAPK